MKKRDGLYVGSIFTVISVLLTFTYIVPIMSIMPAAHLEGIMAGIVGREPYAKVGRATLIVLLLMFLSSLIFIYGVIKKRSKEEKITKSLIIAIMILEYFIVHGLGLYLYWGFVLNFRSDGQLVFAAVSSFPMSSLLFLVVGAVIDFAKEK